MGDCELKNLTAELRKGREIARQLQIHLNVPYSSRETREIMLLQKILNSFEKSLSIVNFSSSGSGASVPIPMTESPPSLTGHSRGEDSHHDLIDGSKKRKSIRRRMQQVRVDPLMGVEGSLDDGFSWRKYGQKDIVGTKYPREYYRCTHRKVQGCLATKQVQRSDYDATILETTYLGSHTCNQATHVLSPSYQQEQSQDLDSVNEQSIHSFHFPSTSIVKPEPRTFSPSMANNCFMSNFSPSLMSPSTSGVRHSFGGDESFHQNSGSELNDIISAATSVTNHQTVGIDFSFVNDEFDPNFDKDKVHQDSR
ncbi:hypothetical protein K2173_011831 [Erythroxylum novogranatense]|uniref:WRKY domain-containing protein n=1 Tax=Erythroxylum novogranatense TaxID=1862640 RepID=A0AAV8SM80_9ROSI|nr:hypothetical protein K2173_011831 [Erythroxylum novogranatense]